MRAPVSERPILCSAIFKTHLTGGTAGARTPNLMLAKHLRSHCATIPYGDPYRTRTGPLLRVALNIRFELISLTIEIH